MFHHCVSLFPIRSLPDGRCAEWCEQTHSQYSILSDIAHPKVFLIVSDIGRCPISEGIRYLSFEVTQVSAGQATTLLSGQSKIGVLYCTKESG